MIALYWRKFEKWSENLATASHERTSITKSLPDTVEETTVKSKREPIKTSVTKVPTGRAVLQYADRVWSLTVQSRAGIRCSFSLYIRFIGISVILSRSV